MDISATFEGKSVRIVNIDSDGSMNYVSFIDGDGNLRVIRKWTAGSMTSTTSADTLLATAATGA